MLDTGGSHTEISHIDKNRHVTNPRSEPHNQSTPKFSTTITQYITLKPHTTSVGLTSQTGQGALTKRFHQAYTHPKIIKIHYQKNGVTSLLPSLQYS